MYERERPEETGRGPHRLAGVGRVILVAAIAVIAALTLTWLAWTWLVSSYGRALGGML